MTFDEFVGDIIDHMLVVDTAISPLGALAVDDPKSHLEYVRSMAKGGIAAAVEVLKRAPDKSMLWALCRHSKGLALNSDGYYLMGQGNPFNDGTFDGEEIATTVQSPDKKVSGSIVAVEVTYTSAASAPAPAAQIANPFGSATLWRYAEPDSATAIRRKRSLSTRHAVNLYSFEIVAKQVYAGGNGIRLTFFPDDFGSDANDSIPRGLHFLAMAFALSKLYGQKAGATGINAARYYANWAAQYAQLLLDSKADFAPLPPYMGT